MLTKDKNKNSFEIPEGYFSELKSSILKKTISKDNPFEVPEGYFENSSSEILNKVDNQQHSMIKKKGKKRWLIPTISVSVAASIIFLVAVFFFDKETNSIVDDKVNLPTVAVELNKKVVEEVHESVYEMFVSKEEDTEDNSAHSFFNDIGDQQERLTEEERFYKEDSLYEILYENN